MEREELEIAALNHQIAQAKSQVERAKHRLSLVKVVSPVDGVVLKRDVRGEGTFPAGTELLQVGNLSELEVIGDVLTQDAIRMAEGSEVELHPAAKARPLTGKVKRIEPAGFTKLSSLGVEQQRVKVIVSFDQPPQGLGVGYRLRARFITDRKVEALLVPRYSVLQDSDSSFFVFKIESGRLKKSSVSLGLESDLELEIVSGLEESDLLVAHPDTTLREGNRVKVIE